MVPPAQRLLLGNDLVREARRRAGLTQRELAERVGSTQSSIARLESGRTAPSFESVLHLVRACGFDLDVMLVEAESSAIEQAMRNVVLEPSRRLEQLEDTVRLVQAGRAAMHSRRTARDPSSR